MLPTEINFDNPPNQKNINARFVQKGLNWRKLRIITEI
jgi:hypothetical protein